jgi:hypothetical protein
MGMASRLAAQKPQVQPTGQIDGRISRIQGALSKVDLNFKSTGEATFTIDSDDLRITIKADDPVFYEGKSFQDGAPQTGLYGPVRVSDKFYGVERVLHYLLSRRGVPYGGVQLQERVTVLFENMLHKPFRPRVFESKPFVIGKEGTFQDRQVMGHFDAPWPQNSLQVLKQDLVIDSELVATVYIVRTTKDILVVGYSVPPLIPALSL